MGYQNKVLQTAQLRTTEIYSLTVLEARHPKSRSWQGHALSQVSKKEFLSLLLAFFFFFFSLVSGVASNSWGLLAEYASIQSLPLSLCSVISMCLVF